MLKIHDVEQKSPEWFALRLEHPLTGSHAQAIGNQGKGLESLCFDELSKKYSSAEADGFSNDHTSRGDELEPMAISVYELETGNSVRKIGFITNPDICEVGGVSPDGWVTENGEEVGNLEVKSFEDKKFFRMLIDYKTTGDFKVESQYLWQIQQEMLFGEKKWTDLVVYNPNYKNSILIKRIEVDPVMQQQLITGLKIGERIIKEIEAKYNK